MERSELLTTTFPQGVPRLWCPLLTHFLRKATPDGPRIHALLREIAPNVKGLLIPGSTGEGWDMNDDDISTLLSVVLEESRKLGQFVLIGALKSTAKETISSIESTLQWLRTEAGTENPKEAMRRLLVPGFTICPPRGKTLSQAEIEKGLSAVLDLGLPTAIYQLPQVTENEIAPETVARLAKSYPNFFLFKDTSGEDKVGLARLDYRGIFFVRGAEGGYSRWPKSGGGVYDGLLLSTANTFSRELGEVLALLSDDKQEQANMISDRITACVDTLFPVAGELPAGNAFANANKVFDHLRAWGPEAEYRDPPKLYGGSSIPLELIREGRRVLEKNGFDLTEGYLRGAQ